MRITKIELFNAELPLKHPFRIAIGVTSVAKSIFVRLHTDTGLIGTGEANILTPIVGETAETVWAVATDIGRQLLSTDPLDIESRGKQMRAFMPAHTTTRSAFDMALYDILAQASGVPLYVLLGGGKRTIFTDNTVGLETPDIMAERAAEFVERGFKAIKIKLGTSVDEDVSRVRTIRAKVGPDIALRLDANQGWTRVEAAQALNALQAFDIEYCEQPVAAWDMEGLAMMRAASRIPIMADEALFDDHDAINLVRANACDYFNIKLTKSAGIHTALAINAIAEAANIQCMIGCMTETRLGLTAAAHLMLARQNIIFADLDGGDMLQDDPISGGMAYGANGEISVPDTPGLGAELDADFMSGLPSLLIE